MKNASPTKQSASVLLEVIAADVSKLALAASKLDSLSVVLDFSAANKEQREDLQRVDSLHQHLDDISSILSMLGQVLDPGVCVDVEPIASSAKLDYLKSRLLSDADEEYFSHKSGLVDLF